MSKKDSQESPSDTTRREAIRLGFAAIAGMGVSALGPTPAFATQGTMRYGVQNSAGMDSTALTSQNYQYTLRVENTEFDDAAGSALLAKASSGRACIKVEQSGEGAGISIDHTDNLSYNAALRAYTKGMGYAVLAQGDRALRVEGRMTMTRSGKAYVRAGKSSVTVSPPYTLSDTVSIFCTMQNSGGSGLYVRYAQRLSSTRFKIQLSKAASSKVKISYMILG